jgi:hydrogenase-4 component B
MLPVILAVVILVCAGVVALLLSDQPRVASQLGAWAPGVALFAAAPAALVVLGTGVPLEQRLPAFAPFGTVAIGLDPLSAVFLLIVLTVGALSALFGLGYLRHGSGAATSWLSFDVLLASMVVVVIARHALLFLIAWETMALASFFLVAYHHERSEVRRAAWTYLVAAHLSAFFLLPMFFLLAGPHGSLDFATLGRGISEGDASLCFVLALVGFGTKAGLVPLHVWLPEAHPVAPSHVSALLSAVMIKMGIYGLLRTLTLLGTPQLSWAWVLLAIGCASALFGVLFAVAQHDLKRLLAYSSVENAGIIVAGIGIGVGGLATHSTIVATLGFAAALVHAVNHAMFKALLFLGAGSVLRATGTTEIDELGGLARRLPVTAAAMLVGCASICCLPPFNGFIGELLLCLAAIAGIQGASGTLALPLAAALASIGMVSALALAAFGKAFGIIFLGTPRSERDTARHETRLLTIPLLVLATACLAAGVAAPGVLHGLMAAVDQLVGSAAGAGRETAAVSAALWRVTVIAAALMALAVALTALRWLLLRGREIRRGPTWSCGYLGSSPSMQYTASSFSQPILDLFGSLVRTRKHVEPPEVHFPAAARLATETPDPGREGIYEPVFEAIERSVRRLHVLQHGRVHVYVLGIVLTLLALLLWQVIPT